MYKTSISKAGILSLLAISILCLQATALRLMAQERRTTTTTTDSHVNWIWDDGNWKRSVEIRGRAEFTDDYTDIKSISDGGFVRIEEKRDGTTRRLDVVRDANGQLQRTYYFNGQTRALDAQDRAWVAGIILEAVRQGAIDAERRVQTIFERRGLNGVLEEISLIKGDYAKRIYFDALLKNRNLNSSALQTVFRQAAREISSDYEQAQFLIKSSDQLAGKPETLAAFFEATATIKSDYEHRRVLSALLKKSAANREVMLFVVRSAVSISSDYEKGLVLKEVAALGLEDAQLAAAFFQPTNTIKSDYERRGVLSAVLRRRGLQPEVLSRVLESAAMMSSDYEKATLLLEASGAYAGDARLRDAFLRTVETIKSDYERGRVLSVMLKNKQME
ncbi:MAG: hypothetical protein ICV60_15630 [Pyrinomonadaceae bacterium]|nr:hypothetical protein [Pyrinomonadaceae bacterium]